MPDHRFAKRVAIVTGAASGIGRATAEAFGRADAVVYGIDIDESRLATAATELVQAGCRFQSIVLDVRDGPAITGVVQRINAECGRIDVVVNVAGINMDKTIGALELRDWTRTIESNLTSIYLMSKAVWPTFQARRAGVIINISSVMGQVGGAGAPAYCSTKSAVIMFSRCLAKDGAKFGIRVNSVCPGYIDTPIMECVLAEQPDPIAARAAMLGLQPLGRFGTADDVARGVLFLASDDASFISGTELTIDGALTATQVD